MPQFTFKRLFCSLLLISAGAGQIAHCLHGIRVPELSSVPLRVLLALAEFWLTLSAGTLLGAGILNLWKRPLLGAFIGTVPWLYFIITHWIKAPAS